MISIKLLLRAFYILHHLMLTTILLGSYFYYQPHCTGKGTEAQKINLFTVTYLVSGTANI